MSELQLSLILIGAIILCGLWFYDRHIGRTALHESSSLNPATEEELNDDVEPQMKLLDKMQDMQSVIDASHSSQSKVGEILKSSVIDPLLDMIIAIPLEQAMRGDRILQITQSMRWSAKRPIFFDGQSLQGNWLALDPAQTYKTIRVAIQMAGQADVVDEVEYSQWVSTIRLVADPLNAEPDIPDMLDVMEKARALQTFYIEHDIQLGINIRSNGVPWPIENLQQALQKQGFEEVAANSEQAQKHDVSLQLMMPDGNGGALFYLIINPEADSETSQELTLLLKLAQVPAEYYALQAMLSCAKHLAKRLDALLVDDQQQALDEAACEQIIQQVNIFYESMQKSGIPAGSNAALRLFA